MPGQTGSGGPATIPLQDEGSGTIKRILPEKVLEIGVVAGTRMVLELVLDVHCVEGTSGYLEIVSIALDKATDKPAETSAGFLPLLVAPRLPIRTRIPVPVPLWFEISAAGDSGAPPNCVHGDLVFRMSDSSGPGRTRDLRIPVCFKMIPRTALAAVTVALDPGTAGISIALLASGGDVQNVQFVDAWGEGDGDPQIFPSLVLRGAECDGSMGGPWFPYSPGMMGRTVAGLSRGALESGHLRALAESSSLRRAGAKGRLRRLVMEAMRSSLAARDVLVSDLAVAIPTALSDEDAETTCQACLEALDYLGLDGVSGLRVQPVDAAWAAAEHFRWHVSPDVAMGSGLNEDEDPLLVFDLGTGFTSVGLFRMQGSGLRALGISGDCTGMGDFDSAVPAWIETVLGRQLELAGEELEEIRFWRAGYDDFRSAFPEDTREIMTADLHRTVAEMLSGRFSAWVNQLMSDLRQFNERMEGRIQAAPVRLLVAGGGADRVLREMASGRSQTVPEIVLESARSVFSECIVSLADVSPAGFDLKKCTSLGAARLALAGAGSRWPLAGSVSPCSIALAPVGTPLESNGRVLVGAGETLTRFRRLDIGTPGEAMEIRIRHGISKWKAVGRFVYDGSGEHEIRRNAGNWMIRREKGK
jgi:hypothetical protein